MIKHMRWAAVGACATALMIVADGASAASTWTTVTGLPPTGNNVQFQAALALSDSEVWAVGAQFGLAGQTPPPPAAYHWDGTSWSSTTTPPIGFNASLNAVSASSTSDVWAVGGIVQPGYRRRLALYEHWTGGPSWTKVDGPLVGGLNAVATLSPTNAWAVGALGVVVHWDGKSWTDVTSTLVTQPNPSNIFGNNLTAITAISASDIWTVGRFTNTSYTTSAYALHFNGSTWASTVLPQPPISGPSSPILHGVTAFGSNHVWAVGDNEEVPGLGLTTLIYYWDGSRWSMQSPSLNGAAYPALNAVAARSATDVYAVGFDMPSVNGGTQQALILRWNGSSWSIDANATATGAFSSLYGAATRPGATAEWAVGVNRSSQGLVLKRVG